MTQKLRGPALSQAVRDYIKNHIIKHNLHAGDPLPSENQLAEDLGVGRSSVREAVKSLQSLGIVEARHGNGLFVREWNLDPVLETMEFGLRFNTKSLGELLDIRIWLESAVMADAIAHIEPATIAALDDILNGWQAQIESGDFNDAEWDEQFHCTLYGSLGNETMLKLFEVFWIAFQTFDHEPTNKERKLRMVNCHRAIAEAVKQGDIELAKTRLYESYKPLRDLIKTRMAASAATKPQ
jgi:DNA-binding FadR family transcriptional regulator